MILKPAALLAAIVSLTFASAAFAADPVNIEIMALEEEPGRMVLTVSAVDENGQPFLGLDPSSFNAWINDTALIVKQLTTSTDREPASVLLLIDTSSSMQGAPIEQARIAINEFIDVLEPNDEVAVMTFSNGVSLVQDFTSDRGELDAAVSNLTLTDDTALYDGVIEAATKMVDVSRNRKLVVLLSDGLANINHEARDGSIETAREAGVTFIAVGLGANTDREYLIELTNATGGELIEAATPEELRQAFTSLAFAIRSQYTLVAEVPRSIDRTVAGTLKVHVIYRADNAFAERALGPLAGAIPPPFTMSLAGIDPGDKHNGVIDLIPTVQEGIEVVKMEYFLNDEVVQTSVGIGSYTLDASLLENGSHVLKVVATDAAGREGEVQIPFLVPVLVVASEGSSLPIMPILVLAVLLILGFFIVKFAWKRWLQITTPTYSRVDTWTPGRVSAAGQKAEDGSDEESEHPLSRPSASTPRADVVQGRVVLMDEAAVQGGELETIREFEMKSLPLTFGSAPDADIQVDGAGGLIAAEEARIWVQRGRLVYHKLTTLSAMATEGITPGWQFLDNGDEIRVGPYRLIFQVHQEKMAGDDATSAPERLPQEHGMALQRSFGRIGTDQAAAPADDQDASEEPVAARDDPDAPLDSSAEPGGVRAADSEQAPPDASGWGLGAGAPPSAAGWSDDWPGDAARPVAEEETSQQTWKWDSTPPVPPADGGPMALEPKSADWLVERSLPIEGSMGLIAQPDAWVSSGSADDEAGSAPPQDADQNDSEDEPERRAWGT